MAPKSKVTVPMKFRHVLERFVEFFEKRQMD